jgi:phosphonate transport system permease protein
MRVEHRTGEDAPSSLRPRDPAHAGDRKAFRWLFAGFLIAGFSGSLYGSKFAPQKLFQTRAIDNAQAFFRDWWPPHLEQDFLLAISRAALQTVAIAAEGMALAILIGLPLGMLCSRTVLFGAQFASGDVPRQPAVAACYGIARTVTAIFRSIPEVIWALVFVQVFGLGTTPAILALGVAYGGMLGKVYSEHLEAIAPRPAAAVEAVGATRLSVFGWGILPQAFPAMAAYTCYRFECAVRAGALMGFVGAGGIGFRLEVSMMDSLYHEVLTEVIVLVAVVAAIEIASDWIQRRLA